VYAYIILIFIHDQFEMRFHCLAVQHTITNKEYIACAFTQKVLKFCEMMSYRGHTIIHYGHEDSEVVCTEHVTVMPRDVFNKVYGVYDHRHKLFVHNQQDEVYTTFNTNAINEISKRKQPGDFLLAFWGTGHQAITNAHQDLIIVEPGIGYSYTYAPYKVFESYAIYHAYLTLTKVAHCFVQPSEYERDAIIPNYFDPKDFDFTPELKEDYFLFVGRIGVAKGLGRAIAMTKALGVRLIVAGQNAETGFREEGYWPIPDHVTCVGYVGVDERKRLMARARAVVCFSTFVEPFCGVHVEAMFSGTPVITSDWGAMTEFNIHGVTGFRCRTLEQLIEAGRNIHTIRPEACREWAMSKFSTDVIAVEYEKYFARLEGPAEYEERPFAERLIASIQKHTGTKSIKCMRSYPKVYSTIIKTRGLDSPEHDTILALEYGQDFTDPDKLVFDIWNDMKSNGDVLVWSSAQNHGPNAQPKQYWIDKFTNIGFVHDVEIEKKIMDDMLNGYHMGWFIQNGLIFRKIRKIKIAVWSEQKWALGRIARSIKKYLKSASVDLYDWTVWDDNLRLFEKDGGLWNTYDWIITKNDVFEFEKHFKRSMPNGLLEKLIVISHCPRFNCSQFYEPLRVLNGPVYGGVSRETCNEMKKLGVPEPLWIPFGADTDVFRNTHTVGNIKRIGIIGGSLREKGTTYSNVKGFVMFEEICKNLEVESVYIHGMDGDVNLYKNIDLLICCSEFEAGPLGIFEAAACGIPVLTRPVGNARHIKGITTFDTIEDAVRQITTWNNNVPMLEDYTKAVTHEVRTNWSMEKLIKEHFVPCITQRTNIQNIPVVYMHTGKQERKENMERTLIGFSNVTCHVSKYKSPPPYHEAYNKDLIDILDRTPLPFIFMEDDCSRTEWFKTDIDIPIDTDALYIGNSEWGVIPGKDIGTLGTLSYHKKGNGLVKVDNMLGMHGVIIYSERWRKNLLDCCRMGIHQDVAIARTMKEFNVYALHDPIVYQDPAVGGTQTPVTFKNIPRYTNNLDFNILDFIEIGTSDFNTEIESAQGKRGLSVEPIKRYLDALPDVEGVAKECAAISNYDGHLNIYSITPETITTYNLPDWLRGCNSVNNYHPTCLRLVLDKHLDERKVFEVERVQVMTFGTLVKKHNIHGCRYLKIDTEGHDVVIVDSYLDCVDAGEFTLVPKIRFEANCLTDNTVIERILQRLSGYGYNDWVRDGDDIVIERL
jgi:glycosyltransferase involved in cell wall biosynthesis